MTGSTGEITKYPYPGTPGLIFPTEITYITTLDDLVQYYDTSIQTEATDKEAMNLITNPSTSGIQQNLIEWASLGFPVDHRVLSVSLIRPSPCSDGKVRDMQEYIFYLTGSYIASLTIAFQKNFLGIEFSYSITGNVVNLHACKA